MSRYHNRKGKSSSFPITKYVLCSIIALVCLLVYLWQQTENEALRIRIEELKMKKSNLQNINQHLQLELDHLIKLSNVDLIAKKELKMKYPAERQEVPAIKIPEIKRLDKAVIKSAKSF